jgi:outer membrane protein assembly factor BamB
VSEVQRRSVAFPGGLAARFRWSGSGSGDEVFGLSEDGGSLADHGQLAGDRPERLCRAEVRVEGPLGAWTARLASVVFDAPEAVLWDTEALLVVKYGFLAYALASRTGELRWSYRSGTPLVAVLASTRLPHVLVQGEVETVALDGDGEVRWRVAHADVVAAADLVAGSLALTSYGGTVSLLDATDGRTLPR